MSNYKLTFKLKQHTPIIHFQYDQHGATLRVTELKPKLDKFLIEKLELTTGDDKKPKSEYKSWFINEGKQHLALDYKVKVVVENESANYKMGASQNRQGKWQTSFPTFFANMGKENKDELINFTMYENIEIIVICFISDLREKIKDLIAEFLLQTNFGTRQSKGFGSFYIEGEVLNSEEPYLEVNKNTSIRNIFEVINYYHQRLKSGVNFSFQKTDRNRNPIGARFCHYEEAFIKKYLRNIEADYIWDKKWLKEKYFPLKNDGKEKRFVRALLGLSYDFDFKTIQNACNPNGTLPNGRRKVSLEIEKNDEIHRIKSPILYKPIKTKNEWRIYIIIDDKHIIDNQDIIKNYNFKFNNSRGNENLLKTPNDLLNFRELIQQYNNDLTSKYTSYIFKGKCCDVRIINN